MKRHIRIIYIIQACAEVIADIPDNVSDSEVLEFLEVNGKLDDARRVAVDMACSNNWCTDSIELRDDDTDDIIYYGER